MNKAWRLALVFAIQAAALIYMIADRQWTLSSGTPIVLETEPVDPRSLFSGDYVRLNYTISNLSLEQVGGDREFHRHDSVYLRLRRGEPYALPLSVHRVPPVSDDVVLRGEVVAVDSGSWESGRFRPGNGKSLRLRYGIETYFVPEGEGREIERPAPGEKVTIRVAVDARGRAAIQALLINGRERYREKLF